MVEDVRALRANFNADENQIADFFGVSPQTLRRWAKRHPAFREVLSGGLRAANGEVKRALFEKATGYSHPYEEIKVIKGRVIRVETTRHIPPDTKAIEFWLKNRCPEEWQDVSRHEVSGPGGGPIPVINLNLNIPGAVPEAMPEAFFVAELGDGEVDSDVIAEELFGTSKE